MDLVVGSCRRLWGAVRGRISGLRLRELGAVGVEYVAIIIVGAGIIVAIYAAGIPDNITSAVQGALSDMRITGDGGGDAGDGDAGGGGSGEEEDGEEECPNRQAMRCRGGNN